MEVVIKELLILKKEDYIMNNTARYIEEYGNVMWATEKEWSEYDKK